MVPLAGEPASLWVAPRGGGLFRWALRGRRGSSVVSWGFFGPSVVFGKLPESFGASVGLLVPAGACWGLLGASWGLLALSGLLCLFHQVLFSLLGIPLRRCHFGRSCQTARLRRVALVSSLIFLRGMFAVLFHWASWGMWPPGASWVGPPGASGVSWSLCGFLGLLGASWASCCVLGRLGACGRLLLLSEALGVSWELLGASWTLLGLPWCILGFLGAPWWL